MKIYILRHGQTILNVSKVTQGHQGGKLTENGVIQANKMGLGLSKISFDYVFCSDLERSMKTLELILERRLDTSKDSVFLFLNL